MKRTIRAAATSSLLALGALGLDACGGDDETTTSVVTETVTVAKKSCGMYPPGSNRWTLEVEGDISCPEARGVFRGLVNQNPPPGFAADRKGTWCATTGRRAPPVPTL
jgi:hypothetical protein